MAHTPGPWEVDGVEIYPVNGHRASDAICEMKPGFLDADARLIAAAPALLEALRAAEELMREIGVQGRSPTAVQEADKMAEVLASVGAA